MGLNIRVGMGFDVHRLVEGRELVCWATAMPMWLFMRFAMPCSVLLLCVILVSIFRILIPVTRESTAKSCWLR